MKPNQTILALDIGTTNIKGLVFDNLLQELAVCERPLAKRVRGATVEQDPQEFITASIEVLRETLAKSGTAPQDCVGLGITNQRETIIVWDKTTGVPVYPAIVWEDTRTKTYCAKIKKQHNAMVQEKTGLEIIPYFSASKIRWLLEWLKQEKPYQKTDNLICGTVDTWVLWNIAQGNPHVTDYTNASRTILYNIQTLEWDAQLLSLFNIEKTMLPQALPSAGNFGVVCPDIFGFPVPIRAVCGDQQASLYAAGTNKPTTKITYGTGAFINQIQGAKFTRASGFFTTLTATTTAHAPAYALEAKVNDSGKKVAAVLGVPAKMKRVVTAIMKDVALHLKKLPIAPKKIIVDGKITLYKDFMPLHDKIMRTKTIKQRIYNGTALGVAMLVQDSVTKK